MKESLNGGLEHVLSPDQVEAAGGHDGWWLAGRHPKEAPDRMAQATMSESWLLVGTRGLPTAGGITQLE